MSKIYKTNSGKTSGSFVGTIAKKIIPVLIAVLCMFGTTQAQVSVTATAGTLGPTAYTTLKGAFDAVNAGTHQGAITISISANTTETATATLNSSGSGSAVYTSLTVKPTALATISGNIASGTVIKLNGADNVTIDGFIGAGPARSLTVTNTNASGGAVIWLGSASATDGATNNTIKNCNVVGASNTGTFVSIVSSSGVTIGGVAEAANSNNSYLNNAVNTSNWGIEIIGASGNEAGTNISNNQIGSVTAANKMGHAGILIAQQQNVLISQNTIFGAASALGGLNFQTSGILVIGTISGGLIERNNISDIKITGFWGCNGIQLQSTSPSTGLTIANNFIYDIASGGFTDANSVDDGGYGIAVNTGGNYNIYYNSIDLSTNQTGTPGISSAFWISPNITTTNNIRNNIFSNRQTTGTRYSIFTNTTNSVFGTINNNDYFSSGLVGFLTSDRATLVDWQTASGQDANSVSADPVYTSVTNLHLAGSSPLNALAATGTGIAIDIDNTARDAGTPDIGADEFVPPNCTTNTPGIASVTPLTICGSGAGTLSATGYSFGLGIEYHWQSSTLFAGPYTDIPGQTSAASGNTGTISITTYFRLAVRCSAGAYAFSTPVSITVNNPQVTGTTSNSRCGNGIVNLSATAAAGTLDWYTAPTGGTSIFSSGSPSNFTTPLLFATTTYYVSNTVAGCEGTRTAVTATINTPPVFTTITAPATICAGAPVTLNATGGGYTTVTWNPGNLPNGTVVNPASTTVYTVTATSATCRRDQSVTITVTPTPTTFTVSPATASVCASGAVTTITATGGTLVGQSIHAETFETFPLTQYAVFTTAGSITATQNTTYYQQGSSSVLLFPDHNSDAGIAMSSSINLSSYANPKLTFSHICATEVSFAHFDFGYVQYSTNGGANWTSFPTSAYMGTGALQNGVVSFDKSSYPDWDAQFTSDLSTFGPAPATSLWKQETIDLSAFASATNFRIRFRMTTDVSVLYAGWLIDNVSVNGDGQAPVTWSPITNLYTNVACTPPFAYVAGTPATTVYSNTPVTVTYTATATGGPGCTKTATSTLNVSALAASVSITRNPSGAICQGDCVTFTATTVNGGGSPGFRWTVNGGQVNPPAGYNTGDAVFTICNLNNGDLVQCGMFSTAGGCVSNPNLSNVLTMTVNPRPTVSINGPLTVCFPSTLSLTTTGTITNYAWLLDGNPTGGNTSTLNATTAGTYTCIVTSNLGCKDTSAPKVLAEQTYTITTSASNGTISPLGVTVVNCGDNQVVTYAPNAGYTLCDVIVDGVSVGTPASPYTFTNVTANHTINVVFCVPGCPYVYTAVAGPLAFICRNQTYTLGGSISCTPANGSFAATWSTSGTGAFNGGGVFGVATTYTPGVGEPAVVFLTLTTNNPGGGACVAASSTMQLRIREIPTVSITGTLGICTAGTTGTVLTAVATPPSATTITGYQWLNVTTSTALGTAVTQPVTSAATYQVTTTASNTCTNSATVAVVTFPTPTVSISPASATVCSGATAALTATGAGGSGSYSTNAYVWYNPAVIAGETTNTLNAAASGTPYTVTVQDSQGCLSNASTGVTVTAATGPLNGAYTIGVGPASCTNYVSFAAAIADLNTRNISGNVRFDVPAGYSETIASALSLGSATLNPTTAGRTITFQKSGSGANPVINAYVGIKVPTDVAPDGIWNLKGIDNVTISSIDLFDGNTTNPATMEYGYGLFKLSPSDGAQNNTIQNCVVTLKRVNDAPGTAGITPDGSTGIVVINTTPTTTTTAITPASAAGTNSNNIFYGNTVQNCNTGIALMGFAAGSPFTLGDTGNDIGGTSSITGNNILNFGGAVATGQTAHGIRANNQWDVVISYNTINNNNGSGVSATNTIRGIYGEAGTSANATITNNTVTLDRLSTAAGCIGIENAIGSTAAGNTIQISNNVVKCTFATAATGTETAILNTASATNVNITGNTVQNCTLTGTGNWTGISNAAANAVTTINNNILQNCNLATTGIGFIGIGHAGASTSLIMNGNTINNITKAVNNNAATITSLMSSGSPATATINSNTITNNVLNPTGTTAAATFNCVLTGANTGVPITFNGNTINTNSITMGGTAFATTLIGYSNVSGTTGETVTNNIIRNLFITGTATTVLHTIRGISMAGSNNVARIITGNQIDNLYSTSTISAAISGISEQLVSSTFTIAKNKIHSLFPGQSATAGAFAKGIVILGATVNASNNYISIDLSQASGIAANSVLTGADAVKGIEVGGGAATNLYYNTIRLAGNGSGTAFGSSGIGITSTGPTVDMRDNLVNNLVVQGATGITTALRKSAVLDAKYATTSNNNLWNTTQTANTPIYYEVATAYATIGAFMTYVTPRETKSIADVPVFVNIATNDLHLAPGGNCNIDGSGAPVVSYTDDYDVAAVRDAGFPDIGADEFDATGGSPNWKGVSTDWLDPKNWCGVIPTVATNVVIPAGKSNYPTIITGTPVANNITIAVGGTVTLSAAGTLSIKGNFANSGTLANSGRIVLNGTATQTFPGNAGTVSVMNELEINNNGAGASIDKALVITGGILPTLGTVTLNNNNITLRSTATGTARVAAVGTTDAFNYGGTGRFIVERYIATGVGGALHGKSWQLLAAATKGQTVNQSWMEGATSANQNLVPGFGTQITSNVPGAATFPTPGFDVFTAPGPSMKTYDPVTATWIGIANTGIQIANQKGYMVFVRGDRSVTLFSTPATTTTLRTTGKLYAPGVEAPATTNVLLGKFESIGNPYASTIDFTLVARTGGTDNTYYVWDPKLAGSYGLGGYQTISAASGWTPVPGGTANYPGAVISTIQSGQAFFVHATGSAGTVSFAESNKVSGSSVVFKPVNLNERAYLRAGLYTAPGNPGIIADANVVVFSNEFGNAYDGNDALKIMNSGENFAAVLSDKVLSIEARSPIVNSDTIFYTFSNLRKQTYELRFAPENLNITGIEGYLVDKFLDSKTNVSLTDATDISFEITDAPGSFAADRFMLVFRKTGVITPVKFASIKATRQDKNIRVDWKISNELNINHYELEKSADGTHFTKVNEQLAKGNGTANTAYDWLDANVWTGDNFYRVRSVGMSGEVTYSQTVKVTMEKVPSAITVFPNPVQEDRKLSISLTDKPAGDYKLRIVNSKGQQIMNKTINHAGGDNVYTITMVKAKTHGNYLLTVTGVDNVNFTFKIVY